MAQGNPAVVLARAKSERREVAEEAADHQLRKEKRVAGLIHINTLPHHIREVPAVLG